MHTRAARAARGATVAVFATTVAAFSHTVADGVAPSLFGILASLVISIAACTLLTGRTLSLPRLAVSVGVSQLLFHGLFSTLGTPVPVGHQHTPVLADAGTAAAHGDMIVAHLAAGLITLVALRHAERAFWGLRDVARLLFARLTIAAAALLLAPHRPRPAVPAPTPWRDLGVLFSPMRYRGPPALNGAR